MLYSRDFEASFCVYLCVVAAEMTAFSITAFSFAFKNDDDIGNTYTHFSIYHCLLDASHWNKSPAVSKILSWGFEKFPLKQS